MFLFRHYVTDKGVFPESMLEDMHLHHEEGGTAKKAGYLPYLTVAAGLAVIWIAHSMAVYWAGDGVLASLSSPAKRGGGPSASLWKGLIGAARAPSHQILLWSPPRWTRGGDRLYFPSISTSQ